MGIGAKTRADRCPVAQPRMGLYQEGIFWGYGGFPHVQTDRLTTDPLLEGYHGGRQALISSYISARSLLNSLQPP